MWEVLTFGYRPYYEVANKHVRSTILAGIRLQCPIGCPHELYAIMEKCWGKEPTERISAAQAEEELSSIFNAMNINQPREQTWSSTDPHEYLSLYDKIETSACPEEKISVLTTSPPVRAAGRVAVDDSNLAVPLTTPKKTVQSNQYSDPWANRTNHLFRRDLFSGKAASLRQPSLPFPAGNDTIATQQGTNNVTDDGNRSESAKVAETAFIY